MKGKIIKIKTGIVIGKLKMKTQIFKQLLSSKHIQLLYSSFNISKNVLKKHLVLMHESSVI